MHMVFMVVVLYFFFFKQKTAYEMRISDWSSDVCSSDLSDIAAVEFDDRIVAHDVHVDRDNGREDIGFGETQVRPPGLHARVGGADRVLHAAALVERKCQIRVGICRPQRGGDAVGGSHNEFLQKIGRAASRESGWPYGENPGGA